MIALAHTLARADFVQLMHAYLAASQLITGGALGFVVFAIVAIGAKR